MTLLDNYMFRPLLAILRLSSRELKVLLYIMCTHTYIHIYTHTHRHTHTHTKRGWHTSKIQS